MATFLKTLTVLAALLAVTRVVPEAPVQSEAAVPPAVALPEWPEPWPFVAASLEEGQSQ